MASVAAASPKSASWIGAPPRGASVRSLPRARGGAERARASLAERDEIVKQHQMERTELMDIGAPRAPQGEVRAEDGARSWGAPRRTFWKRFKTLLSALRMYNTRLARRLFFQSASFFAMDRAKATMDKVVDFFVIIRIYRKDFYFVILLAS
mgnify:CR=1 FL=1